jgi:nitrite reductase (NO-forming)
MHLEYHFCKPEGVVTMFLKDPNDRPLIAVAIGCFAIGLVAWSHSPNTANPPAGTASITQSVQAELPADYGAPALNGTTRTPIPKPGSLVDIVRDPADLPAPVGHRGPRRVKVDLYTEEVTGKLADGATFRYWTFNGKVPGPFVRVRVGDVVEVHLKNEAGSMMNHNVDFHAVTGPGGGAKATESEPGNMRGFEFKAEHPGLFVYHCAVMPAAQHIANGMYGMILVEPDGGLPKVDHEFYVMQGEIYTEKPFGSTGLLADSYQKLLNETPEYYVFNGAVGALSDQKPLHAKVGETVRIFFGVGGPNKTSSFHVIGEVFDRVYSLASVTSAPLTDVQTITVPPGGAGIVDLKLDVPGKYMLVDHALSRVARGLAGTMIVTGDQNVALFKDYDPQRSAMVMGH